MKELSITHFNTNDKLILLDLLTFDILIFALISGLLARGTTGGRASNRRICMSCLSNTVLAGHPTVLPTVSIEIAIEAALLILLLCTGETTLQLADDQGSSKRHATDRRQRHIHRAFVIAALTALDIHLSVGEVADGALPLATS